MRLIDADALKKKAQWMEMPDRQGINFDVCAVSVSSIDLAPAIDAVPVVRCKDCKHYENHRLKVYENCVRNERYIPMLPDDFCSYGERRSDD